jgi:hypothetical protein
MVVMSRFPGKKRLIWPVVCLALSFACSRPAGPQEQAQADADADMPFQGEPNPPAPPPDGSVEASVKNNVPPSKSTLPFRRSRDLPAGTLIAVRLKHSISAQDPDSRETFNAVVDEPVLIEGNTVLPRGASVAGRVESSLASAENSRGYMRLKLDAIDIAGHPLPLQTASLFVSGDAVPTQPQDVLQTGGVHIDSGRRLTFRLSEPLLIENEPTPLASSRPNSD